MKHFAIIAVLTSISIGFILFTGFQCASQEMTSAKLYIQRSDWENAEKWLAQEVQKNPVNGEAWFLLGQARTARLNYKGAVEAYDNSLKNSNEYTDRVVAAKKDLWSRSLNAGVNKYNQSAKASPDSSKMLLGEAIEYYKTALIVNPDSAITYQYLAFAQHSLGSYDEEIVTLQEALKKKPTSELHTSLINIYLTKAQNAEAKSDKQSEADNYEKAITAIKDARKFDPNNSEMLGTMIDIYVRTGKSADAKPYISEAIQRDPSNKVYQYNLGVLLMQTDSLEEAIKHFELALKTDPKYDVALQNIGVAYMRIGAKMKEAAQNQDVKKNLDRSHIEKFKKAVGYFEQLVELKKEDATAWDLMASAYANSDMLKEAKQALEKADSLRKK